MRYQPQGRARLDQSNPLVRGLVFASVAGGPDLISGTLPRSMGAAARSAFEQGKTLYTPGVTSDGWYWPLPANHPLYGITTQDTIFVLARRIAGTSYNNLLGVPYRAGAWASPYYAWNLGGGSDSTLGGYSFATNSSTRESATSYTGLFTNGVTKPVGSTRNSTRVRFYNGRAQYGVDASIGTTVPDWSGKQPLMLFNRSNTAPGEGMQSHAGLVLVWNRELAPEEWAAVADNPWQLFADAYEEDDLTVSVAPSGLTLDPASVSLSLAGFAPSIVQASTLAPSSASLTLAGYAPALSQAVTLEPATAALVLAGYAPSIVQSSALSPSGASLMLSGYAPIVGQTVTLAPVGAALAFTGYAPAVSQVAPVTLSPSGAVMLMAGYGPEVTQGIVATPMADGGGAGGAGGGGSVREVRAFADLLNQAHKPSRSQKKARRRELEAEALELLPDLPEAEKLAPIAARIVYEQEARALAPLYAERTIVAMQPVSEVFDAHEALRQLIDKLLAEALEQQKVAEDEENDVELLLFGT
jgi:hypothetical protein